jgi:hypothetical protein
LRITSSYIKDAQWYFNRWAKSNRWDRLANGKLFKVKENIRVSKEFDMALMCCFQGVRMGRYEHESRSVVSGPGRGGGE